MQFHITKNHKRVVCVYMFNYQLTEFFHCASSFQTSKTMNIQATQLHLYVYFSF